MSVVAGEIPPQTRTEPWQLQLFRRSLKKRQKLTLLLDLVGRLGDEECLLITNGDNNGALNHQFRAAGGNWTWVELESDSIPAMEGLLGERVHHAAPAALPFPGSAFDRVVVIDVHEHLEEVDPLNREIARILRKGGRVVVTVPNGDQRLPVVRLKHLVGMGPEQYGHVVVGYRVEELEEMMRRVGLEPEQRGAYARFFTELAELAINFGYVKVLSRNGNRVPNGTIAPNSEDALRRVRRAYRMYAAVYPVVRAFSALDALIPGRGGYAVAVVAGKPS